MRPPRDAWLPKLAVALSLLSVLAVSIVVEAVTIDPPGLSSDAGAIDDGSVDLLAAVGADAPWLPSEFCRLPAATPRVPVRFHVRSLQDPRAPPATERPGSRSGL